jgi:hypothetical protein
MEGIDGEWEETEVTEGGGGGGEEGEGEEGEGTMTAEEEAMARMMGFGGFGSSKVCCFWPPSLPIS